MLVQLVVNVAINFFFFFLPLATSAYFIYYLTSGAILTQYQKVRDQIDTFEILWTILTYNLKVRDQICSLPFF